MGPNSRSRIFEWMSKIEDEPDGTPKWSYPSHELLRAQVTRTEITPDEGDVDHRHFSHPSQQIKSVPRVQEEIPMESAKRRHPELQRVEQVSMLSMPFKKQQVAGTKRKRGHAYERRPRHRTKDGRYEYKGKTSYAADRKVSEGEKKKTTKRKRKHTMNDDFHASNVARNRLTLQSNMDLGLFKMGQTSSPVKVRQEAGLNFSAMKFRSHGLRNTREPTYYCGNREGIGDVRWMPQKLDTGASLSLLDTVDGRANRQIYDMFHYGSVEERDWESAGVPVNTNPGNQSQNEGSWDLSQVTTIPYTWSESVRISPAKEDPFDLYTRQLLNVNLDAQETRTTNPSRKYWTLEDLKCLLEQRRALWDSQAYAPVVSANQSPLTKSQKRKRSPSADLGITTQASKVRRMHDNKTNVIQNGAIGAPPSSHHGSASHSAVRFRDSGDINGEPTQTWQPTSASSQLRGQADILDAGLPESDFTLYPDPETSSSISSSLRFRDVGSTMHYGKVDETCELDEAGTSAPVSVMDWEYDKSLTHHANEIVPLPEQSYTLIAQTLSAAYNVIMYPELDPLYNGQGCRLMDITRGEDHGVGNNASNFQESNDLSSCWPFEEGGAFSHDIAREEQRQQSSDEVHQILVGQFPEARRSAGEAPKGKIDAESRPTSAVISGLQEDILGGLKGFWRQQKLY